MTNDSKGIFISLLKCASAASGVKKKMSASSTESI